MNYNKYNLKSIIITAFTLVILTIFINGCYGTYEAEREYWLANREYARLMQRTDIATKEEFEDAIVVFRKILIKYPGWPNSAHAQFNIGNLYMLMNEQARAVEEYEQVVENFSTVPPVAARALFALGLVYQQRGELDRAQDYFNQILDNEKYFDTEAGLQTPLHIIRYWRLVLEHDRAEAAYQEAISLYQDYIEKYPEDKKNLLALGHLVNSYGEMDDWEGALAYLQRLVDKYPDSQLALQSLFITATIYETQLNDKEKANAVYIRILTDYPDSAIAENIRENIKLN